MLFDWMKSLIFYLLFAGIVIHMTPSVKYKQYIRYFSGLVVLVLLSGPIRFLFEFGSGDIQELLAGMETVEHLDGEETLFGSIYDYYDMGLRESIRRDLDAYPVEDISLITDAEGALAQCTVYLSQTQVTEEMEKEIKKCISDVYNLDTARIYVISR